MDSEVGRDTVCDPLPRRLPSPGGPGIRGMCSSAQEAVVSLRSSRAPSRRGKTGRPVYVPGLPGIPGGLGDFRDQQQPRGEGSRTHSSRPWGGGRARRTRCTSGLPAKLYAPCQVPSRGSRTHVMGLTSVSSLASCVFCVLLWVARHFIHSIWSLWFRCDYRCGVSAYAALCRSGVFKLLPADKGCFGVGNNNIIVWLFFGSVSAFRCLLLRTNLLCHTSWVRGDSSPSGHSGYGSHISHPR